MLVSGCGLMKPDNELDNPRAVQPPSEMNHGQTQTAKLHSTAIILPSLQAILLLKEQSEVISK